MTETITVLADPNGASQAETPAGSGEAVNGFTVGAHNAPPKPKAQGEAKQVPTKETPAKSATPSKEERHAAQKITELAEHRITMARLALDSNPDAIYEIASVDEELATKLLKEYEYGTEDLKELLSRKDSDADESEESKRNLKDERRIKKIEQQILEEKVEKLRTKHSDLKDELEEEFRKVYSNPAFESYDDNTKLSIARALAKKPEKQASVDALSEVLLTYEGAMPAVKASPQTTKKKLIPDESRQRLMSGGVTEEKAKKWLPENIDEVVAGMLSPAMRINTGD